MQDKVVTAEGTPNIALIKYWGKRDGQLVLPMNSSISITLGKDSVGIAGKRFELRTKTSVVFSKSFENDVIYVNGKRQDLGDTDTAERFKALDMMRERAGCDDRILMVSENSFPTASGLASSASGMAALVYAVSNALDLNLSKSELSVYARMGSGSACRSVMGGIVMWDKGMKKDGSDSIAKQLYTETYWPGLTDVVAIASASEKKVPSRSGMAQTVATSSLYRQRLKDVDERIDALLSSLKKKDFHEFARIIMADSNSMHATMLDTYPPIMYMSDISRDVVYAIHELNRRRGENICGYTFDAGPNPQIITLRENVEEVAGALKGVKGIKSMFYAGVGGGPRILGKKEALIDEGRLAPKG